MGKGLHNFNCSRNCKACGVKSECKGALIMLRQRSLLIGHPDNAVSIHDSSIQLLINNLEICLEVIREKASKSSSAFTHNKLSAENTINYKNQNPNTKDDLKISEEDTIHYEKEDDGGTKGNLTRY